MHSFFPVESLSNASQMTFLLPRFLGPLCYIPNGMLLKMDIKLAMIDGTGKPVDIPPTKKVAPCNNTLHSLFKSCRVYLGETLITKNSDNYGYKSYIIDLFSFDGAAKFSWLEGQMYYQDNFGKTLASQTAVGNSGFATRMNLFKNETQSAYHQKTVQVMGRLHTDLNSSETALIPGLGIKLELVFASSDFLIQVPATDTRKYRLTIEQAVLMCPVGQLSDPLFRKIEMKLQKEDARMYITRAEVTNQTIPRGSIFTERLFPGSTLPSKLIFAIIPTENYIGTQTTNPFFFARKFHAPGLGRAGIGDAQDAPPPSGSSSSTSSYVTVGTGGTAGGTLQLQEGEAEQVRGDDDYCYFQRFSLTLNGESVDGFITDLASSREDLVNFIRMHFYMGFMQSRTGNNFTYQEFLNGFFYYVRPFYF